MHANSFKTHQEAEKYGMSKKLNSTKFCIAKEHTAWATSARKLFWEGFNFLENVRDYKKGFEIY